MTIAPVRIDEVVLPDTPYAMWVRGELDEFLHVPEGSKVEVIGGMVVVSPPPCVRHGRIIEDVADALATERYTDPTFPWRSIQVVGLNFVGLSDGHIPDLIVLDRDILDAAADTDMSQLMPDQVELVVEVTSPSNADGDRRPTERRGNRTKPTKWTSYARAELPYYLLIDRAPKVARTTLYSIPDQSTGAYLHQETWEFGETIQLPEPFGIDIDTARWQPWKGRSREG